MKFAQSFSIGLLFYLFNNVKTVGFEVKLVNIVSRFQENNHINTRHVDVPLLSTKTEDMCTACYTIYVVCIYILMCGGAR